MTDLSSPVRGPEKSPKSHRLWSEPQRTGLYAERAGRSRSRRATDVVLLVSCLAGLVLIGQLSLPPSAFEQALTDLARAVPDFLDVIWLVGVGLLSLWGLLLIVASIVRWRLDILRDQLLGVIGATALVAVVGHIVGEGTRSFWEAATATGPPPDPVSVQLAIVVATTVVASPHIARPFRTLSRWLVGFGAVSAVILEATTPSGALLGMLCGATAGAVVHLLLGSSGGRPSLDDVRRRLDELGVEVTTLSEAELQRAGVFLLDAIDTRARPLEVKVYGRDAWDSQLIAKAWRALWYRDTEAFTLTRVQQAEHEAFVTLLAAENEVPVHRVVQAGRTAGGDALIVLCKRGVPLDAAPVVDPSVIEGLWDSVLTLQAAGFAHGDLAPSMFRVEGAEVVVDGLAGAVIAATEDQRRVDLAQLLITSALMTGPEQAVAVAKRRLGADGLATVPPYLQVAAMGPRLRAALDAADLDLDDLRARTATAAGVDEPGLAKLRRVSARNVIQAALMAFAAYYFISLLAGIDFAELADALRDASVAVLLIALVFGQVPRLAQAESPRAACPRPLPYGLMVLLQFAITFVNVAIPSTAARVGVNVRFFQRHGIPPASAISIGVIDSLAGFAVQILILVTVLLFDLGAELHFDATVDSEGTLLVVLAVLAGVALVVAVGALVVPRARRWVVDRVRPWIHEALDTLSTLRSPGKAARVLGANLAAEVLFAMTLGIVLAAFGTSLPLATLLVVNVSVALFSGIMPVPGGIGVCEGAYVVMLTAAGVGEATALGVAIAYRLCTAYLPPLWGSVAFRRLERDGYL